MEELSKKELKQAIKNHPRMKEYKKTMRIMLLIFLIGGAVGIFVLPPLGITCIVLLALGLVIYLISLILLTAILKSQIKKKGVEGAYAMYKRVPVAKKQNPATENSRQTANHSIDSQGAVNEKVSEVLDNPAVGVAASYALGKTVQNANKQAANKVISRLEKNRKPFSETLKEHDWASGHRIPFNRNTCYTCAYWNGERKIERDYILIPQNAPSAKCSKTVGTIYVVKSNCRNWKPLK